MRDLNFETHIKEIITNVIQTNTNKEVSKAWLKILNLSIDEQNNIYVHLPNIFFKKQFERSFKSLINKAIAKATGKEIPVHFTTQLEIIDTQHLPVKKVSAKLKKYLTISPLNPEFTLDNFIVGAENQYLYSSILSMLNNIRETTTPFFIQGGIGLGKTHLLQAIFHHLTKQYLNLNICYLTCEDFVNTYIAALHNNSIEAFRKCYRNIDTIIIDDIHFLAKKEASQEEFAHMFHTLYNTKKLIILSSLFAPKEIEGVHEQIKSFFVWGNTAQISPPSFETKIAIIKKKIQNKQCKLTDEVIEYIAANINSNVREIEGVITKIMSISKMSKCTPSLEVAKEVVDEFVSTDVGRLSISDIKQTICNLYKIPCSDLESATKSRNKLYYKYIAVYMARKLTNLSIRDIAKAFAISYPTAVYLTKKLDVKIKIDRRLKDDIILVEQALKNKENKQ